MTAAEAIEYLKQYPAEMPVFVLLGKDRLAPGTVRDWALRARNSGSVPAAKIESAETVAQAMAEWSPRQWPD